MSIGTKRPQDTGYEIYITVHNTTGGNLTIFGQIVPAGQTRRVRMPVDKPSHSAWGVLETYLATGAVQVDIAGPGFDLLEGLVRMALRATGDQVLRTLSETYDVGTDAADQTLILRDASGGAFVLDATNAAFSGNSAFRVNFPSGGVFVLDRATGRVGIGAATAPAADIHIHSTAPGVRLQRTSGPTFDVLVSGNDLHIVQGATLVCVFQGAGGIRVDGGVGVGIDAAAEPSLVLAAGSTAAVSAVSSGKFRYNETLQRFEYSENGSAYRPFSAVVDAVEEIGIRITNVAGVIHVYNRLREGQSNSGLGQSIYGGTEGGEPLDLYGSAHPDNGPVRLRGSRADVSSLAKGGIVVAERLSGTLAIGIPGVHYPAGVLLGEDGEAGEPSYIPGIRGFQGNVGERGAAGVGVPGADGEDGLDSFLPGAIGYTGPRGNAGIGIPGLDGEDGESSSFPGIRGATGPAGVAGSPGLSALTDYYDEAFENESPVGTNTTIYATTTEQLLGTLNSKPSTPDSIAALWEDGGDINNGATITLTEGGRFNLITSTTTITAFAFATDKAGRLAVVRFNTARTLTHNATSLILPGAANITTAVGDHAFVQSRGGGNFTVISYTKADGTSVVSTGITQLTSDVTAGPGSGSQAATIANNVVSNAKLRDSNALSVIGRSANSSGDPADISTSSGSDFVLRERSGTLAWGQIRTAAYENASVTFVKMQDLPGATLIGRRNSGTGSPESITLGSGLSMTGVNNNVLTATATLTYSWTVGGYFIDLGNLFSSNPNINLGQGAGFDSLTRDIRGSGLGDIAYSVPTTTTRVAYSCYVNSNSLNQSLTARMVTDGGNVSIGSIGASTIGSVGTGDVGLSLSPGSRVVFQVFSSGTTITSGAIDIRLTAVFY